MAAPWDREVNFWQKVYHHVALPRDVPGREDNNLHDIERELHDRLTQAVKLIGSRCPLEHQREIDLVRLALTTSKAINVEGKIDKDVLVKELASLENDQALILYVTEQNAALLVYRQLNHSNQPVIVFEVFETSAACEKVLAAENAMQWDFPGRAIAVPLSTICDESFCTSLAIFLEQGSIECIKQFSAVTYKAAAPLPEVRDTPEPTLISGLLMSILEVVGQQHACTTLRKRVRDTVSFKHARKPWRRLPFYLVLRVAIQRCLYRLLGGQVGRIYYKTIMSAFISSFLHDALPHISSEQSHFLLQKTGKRIAKLALDKGTEGNISRDVHDCLSKSCFPIFEKSLHAAREHLEQQWEKYKIWTRRRVQPLDLYATDSDKRLSLPLSRAYLSQIAFQPLLPAQVPDGSAAEFIARYEASKAKAKSFAVISDRYIRLAMLDGQMQEHLSTHRKILHCSPSSNRAASNCIEVAGLIQDYIIEVGDAFDEYPSMKSIMFLTLMELWVVLDMYATCSYRLLLDYHPGFDPSRLDVLQLLSIGDMERLQSVQKHLSERCLRWRTGSAKTIFDEPSEESFAARYYAESNQAGEMALLRSRIELKAAHDRASKEEEWQELSQQHEQLIQKMVESSCPYVMETMPDGSRKRVHQKGCPKHRYKWQAKQIKIQIHEHPLPEYEPAAKAAIFELLCPKGFAAYRDATWRLLAAFVYKDKKKLEGVPDLRAYKELSRFSTSGDMEVSLASHTKSHLDSHYATTGFPVSLEDVCRPCGLSLDYFDSKMATWVSKCATVPPSTHFPLILPEGSPYAALRLSFDAWPTSNEIIASQFQCPNSLNVHEFMAWQGLLNGTGCRWLTLLRELGSTNLNFSTESTWAIVTALIHQAGPELPLDTAREIHTVFHDVNFCSKLLGQVGHRLEAIRRNWREPVQMSLLVSIILKTTSLAPDEVIRSSAVKLLHTAREISWDWCATLRSSAHCNSKETVLFAIWACVLCKTTFQIFPDTQSALTSEDLQYYFCASVYLQENLVGTFSELPRNLRTALLQDLQFGYKIGGALHEALLSDPAAITAALNTLWPIQRELSAFELYVEAVPNSWWIQITLRLNRHRATHIVHFNVLRGDFLINGQQSGTLPAEYRQHPIIEALFGSEILRVRPSFMEGMSLYVDRPMPEGHVVHLGFRGDQIVVRAIQLGSWLEWVPRETFGNPQFFDLPAPLVEGCYHWLDLDTKVMEIRQDDIWKSKKSNWRLDLKSWRATRGGKSTLIDPNSPTAQLVAKNFKYFERPSQLVVFQPNEWRLSVELKRLELSFFVNKRGLLQCRQLSAEIPPTRDQDPGLWTGLLSKLVVRSVKNRRQRSILIPTGTFQSIKRGDNVQFIVQNNGMFLKYDVNDILGRLDCPAEPRLLYTKAQWHAYTSHFLPDTLTGRTGVEEAIRCLESGLYQPWTPPPPHILDILISIASLTPKRAYYPSDLRCMETVEWDPNLTTTVQDDRFRALVEKIVNRSSDLSLFNLGEAGDPTKSPEGNPHLERRGVHRMQWSGPIRDAVHVTRDQLKQSVHCTNTSTICELLAQWPEKVTNSTDLRGLLENCPIIGGYDTIFDKVQLFDFLSSDLASEWGSISKLALASSKADQYRLMFIFGVVAFSSTVDFDLLRALASFAILPELKALTHPTQASYVNFRSDEVPTTAELAALMKDARLEHVPSKRKGDRSHGTLAVSRLKHKQDSEDSCQEFAESIRDQWPNLEIDSQSLCEIDPIFLDTSAALELVTPKWTELTQNFVFNEYLKDVQAVLDRNRIEVPDALTAHPELGSVSTFRDHYESRCRDGDLVTLTGLLKKNIHWSRVNYHHESQGVTGANNSSPALRAVSNGMPKVPGENGTVNPTRDNLPESVKELSSLADQLQDTNSVVQRKFASELQESIASLVHHINRPKVIVPAFNTLKLQIEIREAGDLCKEMLQQIRRTVALGDSRAKWLQHAGLWPKTGLLDLLSELRSTSRTFFGKGMKVALIDLGMQVSVYQRLLRIQDASLMAKQQQLIDETVNKGHSNWSPVDHPDWLLLEIDSNVMLREEQVDVAKATISPPSDENSVLQLLMGKGKTSCILPMVAATLANDHNLFRIIVPRPLLLQSAQVLQSRLGGLLNREIIHVPFSRKTPTNFDPIQTYGRLHSDIKKRNGVILALPEHLLSFKLGGLQRLCDNRLDGASQMIKIQNSLDACARDVLDECDVSLAIRTQLIYPSGSQMTVDGHPLRWQIVQTLLRLIKSFIPDLIYRFPRSLEVVKRPFGEYPLIYFLRHDVEDHLIARVVDAISNGLIIPCAEYSESDKNRIRQFVSTNNVSPELLEEVNHIFRDKSHLMKIAYLLRGLLVHRILLSTLKKRWNVQYGIHPGREPIAVPYHAKGVPSPTSEWGHPDVAIILTCLSFYYQGLEYVQFKQSFEQLLKADEPNIEYDKWMNSRVPESLRDHKAVNPDDAVQFIELYRYIRHNVYLIDFFLNNFVFPRHAKQFETKLQASGWDLVQYEPNRKVNRSTTGFSGTNDSRHQLPMTIRQNDLSKLSHTNAEVLSYLLEKRNRRYVQAIDYKKRRLSEDALLERLLDPTSNPTSKNTKIRINAKERIRILIDAGAQILEYDNRSLAQKWLEIDHEASAAVYFDSDHRAWVLYRKGRSLPLVASPFAEDLGNCVVYLDESHCRGIDLKFPPDARAAVTLGPHLTKDAFAQAAMRMRLLGKTQSVTLIAPPEVHQNILDLQGKNERDNLDSSDVVRWLLEQTCNAIEQMEPLYYTQGLNYLHHVQSRLDHADFLRNEASRNMYCASLKSKEMQTLKDMYEPRNRNRTSDSHVSNSSLRPHWKNLQQRRRNFQDRGFATHSSALEEVEVEREVEFEVESVQESQRPTRFTALRPSALHKDIRNFVQTGKLSHENDAYTPMFLALQNTGLGSSHKSFKEPSGSTRLYVSTQYSKTVRVFAVNDNFIRPCQWILLSESGNAIIVSPEEANQVVQLFHQPANRKSGVHLVVYAAPVTRRMLHFNDIEYYAVPPLPAGFNTPVWLKIEVGIFSGRLYFGWDEYRYISGYLGLRSTVDDDSSMIREAITKKPLTFMHEWLTILRKGQDIEHTPMGFLTTGKPLFEDHPFFKLHDVSEQANEIKIAPFDAQMDEDEHSEEEDQDSDDEFLPEEDAGPDNSNVMVYDDEDDEGEDLFNDAEEHLEKVEAETEA